PAARALLVRPVADAGPHHAQSLRTPVPAVKLKEFLSTWRGTRIENRLQRWTIAGLILSNIAVGLAAFARGETVVLVPPDLTAQVAISRTDSDRDYRLAWAFFLA